MNKNYPTTYVVLLLLLSNIIYAQHTFSIAAVDPATGEIGSAGATCLGSEDGARDVSDIILGKGAINTQSWWTTVNQQAARARMEAGDSPQQIITWLQANDNPAEGGNIQDRQYGIVDIHNGTGRSAAFTGSANYDQKGQRTGANYAIQGNILISQAVLDDMEQAFLNTSGSLCEKLMATMLAAKRPGADSRCLSDGISSKSAYIRVAKPTDTSSTYGNLWLDINVWLDSGSFTGDPIDELKLKYDQFKNTLNMVEFERDIVTVYPNPTQGELSIKLKQQTGAHKIELYDALGKKIIQRNNEQLEINLNLNTLDSGLYLLKIYDQKGQIISINRIFRK